MTQNTLNGVPVFNSEVKPIPEKIIQNTESGFTANQIDRESVFPPEMKPVFRDAASLNPNSIVEPAFSPEMKPVFTEKPPSLHSMATWTDHVILHSH